MTPEARSFCKFLLGLAAAVVLVCLVVLIWTNTRLAGAGKVILTVIILTAPAAAAMVVDNLRKKG